MANQWFRLYSEFATDPKVQMLSEAMQRRLIMVFCIRTSYPKSKISDSDFAWRLRTSREDWLDTKRHLIAKGLIDEQAFVLYDRAATAILRPSGPEWALIRGRIFERDDYTCRYCSARGVKLECDHVIPVSRGGDSGDANLVTACFKCNRSKRDKLLSEWKGAGK